MYRCACGLYNERPPRQGPHAPNHPSHNKIFPDIVQMSSSIPCTLHNTHAQPLPEEEQRSSATRITDVSPHDGNRTVPHSHLRAYQLDDFAYWQQQQTLMTLCIHAPVHTPPRHWQGGVCIFNVAQNADLVADLLDCPLQLREGNTHYVGLPQHSLSRLVQSAAEGDRAFTLVRWPTGTCNILPQAGFVNVLLPPVHAALPPWLYLRLLIAQQARAALRYKQVYYITRQGRDLPEATQIHDCRQQGAPPCYRRCDDRDSFTASLHDRPRIHLVSTSVSRTPVSSSRPPHGQQTIVGCPAWINQLCGCIDEASALVRASVYIRITQHVFTARPAHSDPVHGQTQGHAIIHAWR